MRITLVKKVLADGQDCRKCHDVLQQLERRGLLGRIDRIIVADKRDPGGIGWMIAQHYGVDSAPFFVVRQDDGSEKVYTVFFALLREVLELNGHEVLTAPDGLSGVAIAVQHRPEVAVVDIDGVVADVIFPQGVVPFADYPSQPGMLPPIGYVATPELHAAGCRAYNRWLAEFCAANPGPSFGLKLTATTSNSRPGSKFITVSAVTSPLSTCVQSIGHS